MKLGKMFTTTSGRRMVVGTEAHHQIAGEA